MTYEQTDSQPCSESDIPTVCQALDEDANYKFSEKYPDGKQFFQASKRQVPSFSVNSHPSVQNWSTLRLIYHVEIVSNFQPKKFALKVRRHDPQPSIFVRTFSP